MASVLERFLRKVVKGGNEDDCWGWTACKNDYGHGLLFAWGRTEGAHRVSYRLFNGHIPTGACVRHTCDNGPCSNPKHLILGTSHQNVQDRVERGRSKGATRKSSGNVEKITKEQKRVIFEEFRHGTSLFRLTKKFNLTECEVIDIVHETA